MEFGRQELRTALAKLGDELREAEQVEVTIIGGAAGMLTGELPETRTTTDCDVVNYIPSAARDDIERAARKIATREGWPADWFNSEAMKLDIMPAGWRTRRQHVGEFGQLHIFALGRRDLIATKFSAARSRDRLDLETMHPTREELEFAQRYLQLLLVPAREVNLDAVHAGLRLVDAFMERTG